MSLNLYPQLYQTEGYFDKRYDELNDKQGGKIKKKSQNGCVTTWGPNRRSPALNPQRQEFRDFDTSKTPFI